jgi:hypothetical protein
VFVEGACIAAFGGAMSLVMAFAMSVWSVYGSARWSRTVRLIGRLLIPEGAVLGRFESKYIRHNGPAPQVELLERMKMLTKAFRIHFRGGLVCLVGGTLFLSGCEKLPEQARAPIPVRVGKAEPAAQSNSISYTGAVRARWQTELGFRVGGKIIERVVEVGQRVQSGQVLARLDPPTMKPK